MKKFLSILATVLSLYSFSQVLITTNSSMYNTPDNSAVLQIADNNKGFLMPRLTSEAVISQPTESLTFYNNSTEKFNFYSGSKWNKLYEQEDAAKIVDVTRNFVGNSSAKTTVTTFPSSIPSFTIGSGVSGWSDLNVSTTITVSKSTNMNLVTVEGMSQINNTSNASSYQFAIGIFVDNELKVVRKFYGYSSSASCLWKKFNASGVFENLSVGNHVVKVYAYNLPKLSNNYSNITYGGASSSSCDNLNEDMARIYLTAQLSE
jgi:hypothetical protein